MGNATAVRKRMSMSDVNKRTQWLWTDTMKVAAARPMPTPMGRAAPAVRRVLVGAART